MKTSELEIGKWYNIRYRTSTKKKTMKSNWSGHVYTVGYEESLKTGVGQLVKINSGHAPVHEFKVVEEPQYVFAAPNSIKSEASAPNVGLSSMIDADEVAKRVDKLRNLGLDDITRKEMVERIQGFLTTLGIESQPDSQHTCISIPYSGLTTLESLLGLIFKKTLFDEVDDLD